MTSSAPLIEFLTAMADDELILGHRDAEWTGHAPILEEDIAFSNIAQDEIGHALVWYTLLEPLIKRSPDEMGFVRAWSDFRCCRFVSYPKGDFAYTVVRQYLFDEAEQVRLSALQGCSVAGVRDAAGKILQEEGYHLLHSKGLVERLGDATEESRSRMTAAVAMAFPQALGMFELLAHEQALVADGVFPGNAVLQQDWLARVSATFAAAGLSLPIKNGTPTVPPDFGGRCGSHVADLERAVRDLQQVFQSQPGAQW